MEIYMNEKTRNYMMRLVDIMRQYNVSMVEAMDFDFDISLVDVSSPLAICDYLESETEDLDFVQAMIMIWDGEANDYVIANESEK
jgi:hypothetical protein